MSLPSSSPSHIFPYLFLLEHLEYSRTFAFDTLIHAYEILNDEFSHELWTSVNLSCENMGADFCMWNMKYFMFNNLPVYFSSWYMESWLFSIWISAHTFPTWMWNSVYFTYENLSIHFPAWSIKFMQFLFNNLKGRGEERLRYIERVTWKFVLLYVNEIANGNFLYASGNSNRGSLSI